MKKHCFFKSNSQSSSNRILVIEIVKNNLSFQLNYSLWNANNILETECWNIKLGGGKKTVGKKLCFFSSSGEIKAELRDLAQR